jgi:hypothetical protein
LALKGHGLILRGAVIFCLAGVAPAAEFEAIQLGAGGGAAPATITLTSGGRAIAGLPAKVYQRPANGPLSIRIEAYLPAGWYEMRVSYRNPERPMALRITVDGRLQPHYETYRFAGAGAVLTYPYTFRVERSMRHLIEVGAAPLTAVQYPKFGNEMTIEAVWIGAIEPAPPPMGPAKPYLDLWGWMACIEYQRESPETVENMIAKTIAEPYKWGANFVQCYPHIFREGWHRAWSREKIDRFLQECHAHGMLVDEHGALNQLGVKENWAMINRYAREDGNLLARGWDRLVDALEGEGQSQGYARSTQADMVKLLDLLWAANPGSPYNQCDLRPNTGQGNSLRFDMLNVYRGPNVIKTVMCANWTEMTQTEPIPVLAYTDINPIRVFPGNAGLQDANTSFFIGYQSDSRLWTYAREGKPGSIFGGATASDLILRQADDLFRPRALNPDDVHESALWWLGETPKVLPPSLRESVYAASMDPIRHAFTAQLSSTGFDGNLSSRFKVFEEFCMEPPDCPWWPYANEAHPATTAFIQNNTFRMLRYAEGDFGVLQYDPQHLAHFDSNSLAAELGRGMGTESAGKTRTLAINRQTPLEVTVECERECGSLLLEFGKVETASEIDVIVNGRKRGAITAVEGRQRFPIDFGAPGRHSIALKHSVGAAAPISRIELATSDLVHGQAFWSMKPRAGKARPTENEPAFVARPGEALPGLLDAEGLEGPKNLMVEFDREAGNYLVRLKASAKRNARIRIYRDGYTLTRTARNNRTGYRCKQGHLGWIEVPAGENQTVTILADLQYDGAHTLELAMTEGQIQLQGLELRPAATVLRRIERGGHRAVMSEKLTRHTEAGTIEETRRYTAENDAPWLKVEIERSGRANDWTYRIDAPGYDRLSVDGNRAPQSGNLAPGTVMRLTASEGGRPDLIMLTPVAGQIGRLTWRAGASLQLSAAANEKALTLFYVAPVWGNEVKLTEVARMLMVPPGRIAVPPKGESVALDLEAPIAMARTFEIHKPGPEPYLVEEDGWWHRRGGQPSNELAATDFLKLYCGPGAKARVQRDGFIDGIVRSGWGCQYLTRLKDVAQDGHLARCTVQVQNATAYVFAPRIEFAARFTRVRIDGMDWPYYDERFVFLPTNPGTYRVEVSNEGEATPHLMCATGRCEGGRWDADTKTLELKIAVQPWTTAIPANQDFFALIRCESFDVAKVVGAEIVAPEILRLADVDDPGMTAIGSKPGDLEREQLDEKIIGEMKKKGFAMRYKPATPGHPDAGKIRIVFR